MRTAGEEAAVLHARRIREALREVAALRALQEAAPSSSSASSAGGNGGRGSSQRNIVRLLGAYRSAEGVVLALELCELGTLGSNVGRWTAAGQQLQLGAVRYVAAQLLEALRFVHRAGLLHRDVAPEKVLVRSLVAGVGAEVALADFGLCCSLRESGELRRRCGTVGYCAPEVFRYEAYDQKVDMLGLGAVGLLVLEGSPPFERSRDPAERKRVLAVGRTLRAPNSLWFRRRPQRCEGIATGSSGSVRFQRGVAEIDEARRALQRLLCPRQDRACAEEIRKDEAFFRHVCAE